MPMMLAVILDGMSQAHDLARKLRVAFHPLAHAKKAGPRAIDTEERQDLGSHLRVRAVIDGDGDFTTISARAGQTGQIGAEPTAPGPEPRARQHRMIERHGAEHPRP